MSTQSGTEVDTTVDEFTARTGPITAGKVTLRSLGTDKTQKYFLFRPARLHDRSPLLLSVHGISRNARAHASSFASMAQRYGVVVAAPLFDVHRYPDYQRMGRSSQGNRPDWTMNRVVDEVAELTGADSQRVYLFGYSGGAQFAHRYAMAYPQRIAALGLGSAGWYTFPDPRKPYPRGTGASRRLSGLAFDLDRFLDLRIRLFIGRLDTLREPDLNRSRRTDVHQGATRLERAARWSGALRRAGLLAGKTVDVSLCTLAGSGHSFEDNVACDRLDRLVFEAFFGERGPVPRVVKPASSG